MVNDFVDPLPKAAANDNLQETGDKKKSTNLPDKESAGK